MTLSGAMAILSNTVIDFPPSLTLKALSKIVPDDIQNSLYFFFPEKIRLGISCESSFKMTSLIFTEKKKREKCHLQL